MTSPRLSAAAAWVNRPGPAKARSPSAACQRAASADTTTTGCSAALAVTPPTASQPIGPRVTLVSCCVPGRPSTAGVAPRARFRELPPLAEVHTAGKPLALPTATCWPPCAATALTATCASTAPGIFPISTRRGSPPVLARTSTGWRLSGPGLMPAVTTVPSGARATPETTSEPAAPNGRACRQVLPSDVTNAVSEPPCPAAPTCPVTAAPAGPPFTIPAVNPAAAERVDWKVQATPFGEKKASTAGRLATVAGRSRTNPPLTAASPATCGCEPGPAAVAATGCQVAPPSLLSQAAPVLTGTPRFGSRAPVPRFRRAPARRSQLVPLAEVKITGVDLAWSPPGRLAPTAMKPAAVRCTALIWSPGASGIPLPGASVQVLPSGLVQVEPGPSATQAPWPPATKMAPCPGAGTPPVADLTVPSDQLWPPSADTKNWARSMRAPVCDPTATTSFPTLVTRPSVWVMPRPLGVAVKSLPASVAGGKPSALGGGVGPALPVFTPVSTTTATPKTTMARIGIATRIPQPRNSRPSMNCRDQRRLTGSGTREPTSFDHSAPAAFRSGRAWWSRSRDGRSRPRDRWSRPWSVTTWRGRGAVS